MVLAEFSGWWIVGWGVGFGGAVIAALLLVSIIRLGRKIASQAEDVTAAIDGARGNTDALYDLTRTNLALDQMRRRLRLLTGDEPDTGGPRPPDPSRPREAGVESGEAESGRGRGGGGGRGMLRRLRGGGDA